MIIIAAVVVGYVLGIATVIFSKRPAEHNTISKKPIPAKNKMAEQWENFLNYNGSAQMGGDVNE